MLLVPMALFQPVYAAEEWRAVYTVGKFSYTDPPKPDQVFKVYYRATDAVIEDVDARYGFKAKIAAEGEGVLEIQYPRNFPYTNALDSEQLPLWPIVFINREEISPEEILPEISDCFFEFSIPYSGNTEFELAWAFLPTNLPFHGDDIPESCVPLTITTRPQHQVMAGVAPEDVICPEGYQLVMSPAGKPYCATPSSAEILKERWLKAAAERGIQIPSYDRPTLTASEEQEFVEIARNVQGIKEWSEDGWEYLGMDFGGTTEPERRWTSVVVNLQLPTSAEAPVECEYGWDAWVVMDIDTKQVIESYYPTMSNHQCEVYSGGRAPIGEYDSP